MNEQIQKDWVDALRSEKYEQCSDKLKNERNEYCCLGVLTELYIKAHPGACWVSDEDFGYHLQDVDGKVTEGHGLPNPVALWAGIDAFLKIGFAVPKLKNTGAVLVHLNDMDGLNFKQIADEIEKEGVQ